MSYLSNTRIQLKRDTEENWTSKNPVLYDGEIIIVKTNDGKIRKKIGDGVKKFSELPYDEITIDSAISTTSTNPVQNKVITAALDGKAGTAVATEGANGLMSASDKKKLDGIATGANKTDVDSSLSSESIRPVQNRVVKTALDAKLDKTGGTLTGNLTGKYITGTWLQSTAATDLGKTPGKIAVLDDHGWVYYRTPLEILNDIGGGTGGTGGTANAVLYTEQTLTEAQQIQARKNINATGVNSPQFKGYVTLTPANGTLGTGVGLSPTRDGNNFALDISDVNENTPTLLTGVKTPTDADTNAAATVEYVKTKVAGATGATVDAEMSDTSTNAVQNKVIKRYVDDHATGGGFKYFTYNASAGSANMTPAEVKAFIAANPNVPVYMKITNIETNAPDEWGVLQGPRAADGVLTFVATEFAAKGGSQRYIAVTSVSDTAWSTFSQQYLVGERLPSLYAPSFYSEAEEPVFGITEDSIIANNNGPYMSVTDNPTIDDEPMVILGLNHMFFENNSWASTDEIYKYVGRGSILCDIDFALGHVTLIGDVEGAITGYNTNVYNQIRQEIDYERGNIWLKMDFNRTGEHIRLSSWNKSGSTYKLVFFGAGNGAIPVKYEVTASKSSASLTVTGS